MGNDIVKKGKGSNGPKVTNLLYLQMTPVCKEGCTIVNLKTIQLEIVYIQPLLIVGFCF